MSNTNTMQIGQKTVLISSPYEPRMNVQSALVGRERELRDITAAWLSGVGKLPMSPLLLGVPGVGKNRIIYELARLSGKDLFIFQGNEDVTAEDLACAVRFSDDPSKKMDYVLSPLVTAMALGQICFIDEIGKIRPRALALLVSVLDERRYIDSTMLGERIYANDGFRFVAATNTTDLAGNSLPDFIGERLRPVVRVDYPSATIIDRIIQNHFPVLGETAPALIDSFWQLWLGQNSKTPPTPRDALQIFNFTIGLGQFDMQFPDRQVPQTDGPHPISWQAEDQGLIVSTAHLEGAFEVFFGQSAGGHHG